MSREGDSERAASSASPAPPADDADIPRWLAELELPGLVDIHTHFLPEPVTRKVWAYFDEAAAHYGVGWPITYRFDEPTRVATLQELGVEAFAPLVYPHKPGMAEWLIDWVLDFAARTPGAVPTATMFPEPGVEAYLGRALDAGARCVKVHLQVGGFDPRDELLDAAWGLLADVGVPVVVHCGNGPIPGRHTGLDIFAEVLAAHPRLTAVLAHAGMPEYDAALDLVSRYPRVHLDTTMVGTAFSEELMPLPADWPVRLAAHPDRVLLGTDYPNMPYPYAEQLAAIAGWAAADDRLGMPFLHGVLRDNPAALLRIG